MSQAAVVSIPYMAPLAKPRPTVNPRLVAITVSMATFMEVMDTSIANVSLRHIAGNLGASQSESAWVLTSYLVSNAIILPISGWLASVFGRKRFYMTCVALFTFASLLCGFAPSLKWLLFFRILQGIGGGGLAPSEQSILADTFEPAQRGMAFALYGMAIVFAPAIGPTLGGFITDNYNWRWIFFINIPVGILSLILSYRLVHDSEGAKKEHDAAWRGGLRLDYLGFGLVALGLGSLQVVLDKGQEDDWLGSHFIAIFAMLAVVGIIGAIVWEVWFAEKPVVDIALMKSGNLAGTMVLMFIIGFILNATTVLIPQFVQDMLGYSAQQAGMILMPGGFLLMMIFPIAGKLVSIVQPKWLMMAGLFITAGAVWHMSGFNADVTFHQVAMARVYQVIGLPLFFVPLNTLAYSNLPPGKNNNASALMNLMRNLGGSVGIALAVTMLERGTQTNLNYLSAHLTSFDAAFTDRVSAMVAMFMGQGYSYSDAMNHALAAIFQTVQRQATMLAYLQVFRWMSVGCLVVMAVVLTLRKVDLKHKAPSGGH
jgi:DHA2 family multidrug resistance protein